MVDALTPQNLYPICIYIYILYPFLFKQTLFNSFAFLKVLKSSMSGAELKWRVLVLDALQISYFQSM